MGTVDFNYEAWCTMGKPMDVLTVRFRDATTGDYYVSLESLRYIKSLETGKAEIREYTVGGSRVIVVDSMPFNEEYGWGRPQYLRFIAKNEADPF
jgi:hypothetical protein